MEDETGLIECVAGGRLLEKGTPRFSIGAFLEVTGSLHGTHGAPTLDLDSLRALGELGSGIYFYRRGRVSSRRSAS